MQAGKRRTRRPAIVRLRADVAAKTLLDQRQIVGVARRRDAWQRLDPLDELIGKGPRRRTSRLTWCRLKCHDTRRVVAEILRGQLDEAANQQAAADEQHHRHRNLGDNQRATHTRTGDAFAQAIRFTRAGVTNRWQESADDARQ